MSGLFIPREYQQPLLGSPVKFNLQQAAAHSLLLLFAGGMTSPEKAAGHAGQWIYEYGIFDPLHRLDGAEGAAIINHPINSLGQTALTDSVTNIKPWSYTLPEYLKVGRPITIFADIIYYSNITGSSPRLFFCEYNNAEGSPYASLGGFYRSTDTATAAGYSSGGSFVALTDNHGSLSYPNRRVMALTIGLNFANYYVNGVRITFSSTVGAFSFSATSGLTIGTPVSGYRHSGASLLSMGIAGRDWSPEEAVNYTANPHLFYTR